MVRNSQLPSEFDNWFGIVEAAQELKIHPVSLRRLIKSKAFPGWIKFSGKYLVQRDTLDKFKLGYDSRPGRKPIGRLL